MNESMLFLIILLLVLAFIMPSVLGITPPLIERYLTTLGTDYFGCGSYLSPCRSIGYVLCSIPLSEYVEGDLYQEIRVTMGPGILPKGFVIP